MIIGAAAFSRDGKEALRSLWLGEGGRPESLRRGHRREGPRASEGAPARTARLEGLVTDSYMKYFTYG